jgi:hypothetical protein
LARILYDTTWYNADSFAQRYKAVIKSWGVGLVESVDKASFETIRNDVRQQGSG